MTDMKVTYGDDGEIISAEGGNGFACQIDTRLEDDDLQVRYTLTPVGDDALYAGGASVLVTLHRPDPGPNPPEDASAIGAKFAAGFIESIPQVLDATLATALSHAARDASAKVRERKSNVDALIKTIALMLLATNGGDVEATKTMATRLLHGEEIDGLGGVELPPTLTDEDRADAVARTHAAIDTMAQFMAN
jgi:hypothetical protein